MKENKFENYSNRALLEEAVHVERTAGHGYERKELLNLISELAFRMDELQIAIDKF